MRPRLLLVLVALALCTGSAAAAAPRPGARCAKAGATATAKGTRLICKKAAGKLVWRARGTTAPGSGSGSGGSSGGSAGGSSTGPGWQADAAGDWQPTGTPPACPSQLLVAPADLSLATSILYPGQTRGTYKAHGGIRFDNSTNSAITVKLPADAYLFEATRYLVNGNLQIGLDFIAKCGYAIRFGHLAAVSSAFQSVVDSLPAPAEGDSRTTFVTPQFFAQGTVVATSVGIPGDVFFDFGVMDIRKHNAVSANAAWDAQHPEHEWDWYGVCWLDLLPAADSARVHALPPGDGTQGTKSDYCS